MNYTSVQIAEAMNLGRRSVEIRASKEGWAFEEKKVRGGRQRHYPLATLPTDIRTALTLQRERQQLAESPVRQRQVQVSSRDMAARVESAWMQFENACHTHREEAERRLAALVAVETLVHGGLARGEAICQVAAQLAAEGTGSRTRIYEWAKLVRGAPRDAWLALLLPKHAAKGQATPTAAFDDAAFEWFKAAYLTPGKPSLRDTYRRLCDVAKAQGWQVPSEDAVERRLRREVSHETQVMLRGNQDARRQLLPTISRDALQWAVGEAVNGDGLKLDAIWTRFEDGEVINTATLWVWQDMRTRRILAWRLGKTENTDIFRLATYDLTGICVPQHVIVDNTRVAANKLMTGQAAGRHRFKTKSTDAPGLLLKMGMQVHFTNPSREHGNPGAKPIERAFGKGGLHEKINNNPRLQALDCFRKATPVDVAVLREVVAHEVARYNAQEKRRTDACRGRLSFDQAWAEAVAQANEHGLPLRRASESQRRMFLMCSEVVTAARSNGEVRIRAGLGPTGHNAYWCEQMPQYAGKKVAVHYDPENLAADAHIYDLSGQYLCAAQNMRRGGLATVDAGRQHSRLRKRLSKLHKKLSDEQVSMDKLEAAALYETVQPAAAPVVEQDSTVIRPVFGNAPNPERDAAEAALPRTGTDDGHRYSLLDEHLKRQAEKFKANRLT